MSYRRTSTARQGRDPDPVTARAEVVDRPLVDEDQGPLVEGNIDSHVTDLLPFVVLRLQTTTSKK